VLVHVAVYHGCSSKSYRSLIIYILCVQKLSSTQTEIKFQAPEKAGKYRYTLKINSTVYMGLDPEDVEIVINVLPAPEEVEPIDKAAKQEKEERDTEQYLESMVNTCAVWQIDKCVDCQCSSQSCCLLLWACFVRSWVPTRT
jgi:hypothetical protein